MAHAGVQTAIGSHTHTTTRACSALRVCWAGIKPSVGLPQRPIREICAHARESCSSHCSGTTLRGHLVGDLCARLILGGGSGLLVTETKEMLCNCEVSAHISEDGVHTTRCLSCAEVHECFFRNTSELGQSATEGALKVGFRRSETRGVADHSHTNSGAVRDGAVAIRKARVTSASAAALVACSMIRTRKGISRVLRTCHS